MATRHDSAAGQGRGLYLVVTVVALLIAVYLALQVIGFLVRLALLVAAVLIGMAAYRAWKRSP
jgi:hypothetical protein